MNSRGIQEVIFIGLRICFEKLAYSVDRYVSEINFQKILMSPRIRYVPNLTNPTSFNEQLISMKLGGGEVGLKYLVDKLHAKWIINKYLGREYEIPTYAYSNDSTNIEWKSLPGQYIIKPSHLSGEFIIYKEGIWYYNKQRISNPILVERVLETWLSKNHYDKTKEPWYDKLRPKILFEKLLNPPGEKLLDYKFHVFKSKVEFIGVIDRTTPLPNKTVYNREWKKQEFELNYPVIKDHTKPDKFEKMIRIAEKASKLVNFEYIRIDMYQYDNNIYVGEFTLCPSGGGELFLPRKWDYQWGELIQSEN